jgi:antitoxin (DNA-binding transcriptional repressor) of toxin-antitoxin stability system
MQAYSLKEAQEQLGVLVEAALHGETILIQLNEQEVIQLIPHKQASNPRKAGSARNLITIADDFDAPLSDFTKYEKMPLVSNERLFDENGRKSSIRPLFTLILCLLLSGLVSSQDNSTPYEIALQRIEEARVSGARILNLDGLGLTELPPEIGSLIHLQELIVTHNSLNSFPQEIANLHELYFLTAVDNDFHEFPLILIQLENLRRLHLHNNQLDMLPTQIGLMNLYILTLDGNHLSVLPKEIAALENLCFLDLSNNEFQVLPLELSQLTNLGLSDSNHCPPEMLGLYIYNNPLISPPPEVIEQGTPAILDYLRNQAGWHLQRLILGGVSAVGIVSIAILGLRRRNNRGKQKRKSETDSS